MNPDILLFLGTTFVGTLLIVAVAFVVGRSAAELMRLRFETWLEETACSVGAGLGILALMVFLIGIGGILSSWVLVFTTALLLAASLFVLRGAARPIISMRNVSTFHLLVAGLCLLVLVPLFMLPLYPPTTSDSITYHLAISREYAQTGSVHPTPQYRYAVFPQLVEMLFTLTLMMGSDILAQCVSLIFLLVTALAVAAFVRRVGHGESSFWGMALVLSNAALLALAGVAFVDLGLMAFVTLAVFSFERWCEDRGDRWLVFSGLMIGCAAGAKYSALFFPLVLGGLLIVVSPRRRRARSLLLFAASCLIAALPWYLYNAYHTGNPVWPFFSSLFGSAYWNEADVRGQTGDLLEAYGTGTGVIALLSLPWNLFTHPEYFHPDGELSVSLLIGIPFALYEIARKPYARRIAVVAVSFVLFWFYTSQILRYLLPVLPLVCVLAAAGMSRLLDRFFPPSGRVRTFAVAVVALLLVIPGWRFAAQKVTSMGAIPVTPESRALYLEKHLPSFGAIRYLNQTLGSSYALYSYGDPLMAYYAEGEFRGDRFGPWRYSRLAGLLEGGEDELLRELNSMGCSHLLLRDASGDSECKPAWLARQFVVPVFRSPGVALFAVKGTPHAAAYGAELIPRASGISDSAVTQGVRFAGDGGMLYYCSRAGESESGPATVLFQLTWLHDNGKPIRTHETTGTLLPQGSVLRMLSTAPPGSASGLISCSPLGDARVAFGPLSVRSVRFVPLAR